MKRNSINFIITIVLAIILSQFLPWWSIMLASFISALSIRLKKSAVFFVPFLAITLFWIAYAFYLGNANDFILAKKIAVLLPLGGNEYLLMLVTGIVGGIAAGISALFGKQVSLLVTSK
ncbi:hypothetical protein [Winogradskyella haliclonae]|uniref:Uncharacterized protein n=1 Tax=Winogradskyella haliclonae TaxID=2048558 RepID=A0ABQ2BV95_9FLAO|nr:hypothetical protein [Winogradskyella haliclonae]GGI56354.1 hypothetical protein GCM10011444_06630 [Winogradskyella haliclonae]